MRNDNTREIIRSRSTMSYAFEGAVLALISDIRSGQPVSPARRDRGLMVASAVETAKARKVPTWTVSRKEQRR